MTGGMILLLLKRKNGLIFITQLKNKKMGTYSRPGTNVSPYMIDRSAMQLSKSIQGAITAFDNQAAIIEANKNAITQQQIDFKDSLTKAASGSEFSFADSTADMFMKAIDDNYRIQYNSIGRDQTEALKSSANLQKGLDTYVNGLGLLQQEAEKFNKNLPNALSAISNSTDKKAMEFVKEMVDNDGNNVVPTMKDGNVMLNLDTKYGKYTLNLSNYYNSVTKGGPGLINYTEDPSESFKAIFNEYAKKYEPTITEWQGLSEDGKRITTTTRKLYGQVNDGITSDMLKDTRILGELNEDSWQIMSNIPGGNEYLNSKKVDEEWTGSPDQIGRLRGAWIQYSIDTFGQENAKTKQITKPASSKVSEFEKAKQSALKYKNLFTTEVNAAQDILASKSPEDKAEKFMNAINRGIPVKSKDRLQIDKDEKVVFIETPSEFKDQESTFTPIYTFDEINNLDFENLLVDINTNKKNYGVPTEEFSILLGNVEQKTPTVKEFTVSNKNFITNLTPSATNEAARNLGLNLDTEPEVPVITNEDDFYAQELGATVQYNGKLYVITGDANSRSLTLKNPSPKK
ncbi:hypothetical protein OAV25_01435 [Flavobacteriaceae bacterium]|nr:hypothetical protein [Flavobacteriaceae bacterium]